jgi:hemerythrin-like domain-containing protein
MGSHTRRAVLSVAGAAGLSLAAGCAARGARLMSKSESEADETEVAPAEDLMREHGVLNRVLLIYDEIAHRLRAHQSYPPEVLTASAGIIRRFIEDYHEKLEEDFVFPRFERAGRLVDVVTVLRAQHARGRSLTADILTSGGTAATPRSRERLVATLSQFVRMYRPHEAREDTVVFPALHELIGRREYEALGESFEDEEHRRFGARGFEGIVAEVAQLEERLGIDDLARFTPP